MPSTQTFAGSGGSGTKTSLLANFMIGRRIGMLSVLALVGFGSLGLIYMTGDREIEISNNEANDLMELNKLAAVVDVATLQMRRHEKDFILHNNMKYAAKYRETAERAAAALEQLSKLYSAGLISEQLAVLNARLPGHEAAFENLVALTEALGLNEKSGLRGPLNKAVQEIEAKLAELNLDDLTVKMLLMRQHEKDFKLYGYSWYVENIATRQEEFRQLLANTPLAESDKQEISSLLDKYVTNFNAYAEGYKIERASRTQLNSIYADMAPTIDQMFEIAENGHTANLAEFNIVRESTRTTILTIATAVIAIFVIVSLWLSRSITIPIGQMTKVMGVLATGDTRVDIPATANRDEIGQMARAVQVFKDNAVEKQRLETEQAAAAQRAEEEKRQAMLDMADQFERQVKEVVDGVSSQATEMQATAQQMSATAEETSRQAGNVASASDQASANVQTVAATAEELSASITEIGRQVSQSAKIASNAVIEAESTNDTVQGLSEAASEIGAVVDLINDIAGQTNLLALNATIEAARAGDAGKGFAVVAQEVKNLANQTAKATEDISKQVLAVQEETTGAVIAIGKIKGIISEISDISTTISSAVEEQGVSTQEIARNVQQAARGTQDVNDNIGSVNKAAAETGNAAGQVLGASQEMSRQAEGLRGEVDRFLKQVRAA